MWIGAARIVLDYFGNMSLAKKKSELEGLCAELRKKYNISALEVDDQDDTERCVLGFAVVIPANWKTKSAASFVEKILETIDSTAFARVTIEDWELIPFGGETPIGSDDEFEAYREKKSADTFHDRGGGVHRKKRKT